MAHHGSYNSTTAAFVESVSPDVAVASCGYSNSYGHPHSEPLYELSSRGINLYRTDEQGTISVVSDGMTLTWDKKACNDYRAGSATIAAILSYQSFSGMEKNGAVTDELLEALQVSGKSENTPVTEKTDSEEMDYVLNKRSKKFHYPSCKSVDDMSDKNKQFYHGTREELVDVMNYEPCQNCNP